MKNKNQKNELKIFALTVAMALIFFFGSSISELRAADEDAAPGTENTQETTEEQKNIICEQEMTKFTDEKIDEYAIWITNNFQNKSSTTSLLNAAMGEYKNLRTALYDKLYTFSPHQGAFLLTEGLEGPECKRIVDRALEKAKSMLEKNARSTSAVKKSTILLTQYQQMNDKLAKLARDFLQMKAYLDTFSDKLPCYINRSCNKG